MSQIAASALRLTVLCQESPYPATHGGRLDSWNRLEALAHSGVSLQVVVWRERQGDDLSQLRAATEGLCAGLVVCERNRGLRALLDPRYPPRMVSFALSAEARNALLSAVVGFGSSVVLLDGWAPFLAARYLQTTLGLPFVYRSQNLEAEYWRDLVRSAAGLDKVRLLATSLRMAGAEREIRGAAAVVAEIAEEDLLEWSRRGAPYRATVLPPTWIPRPDTIALPDPCAQHDVLFAGNLWAPHNVDGVLWWIREVVPLLRQLTDRPLVLAVAGGKPTKAVSDACRRSDVRSIADPEDIDGLQASAGCLINPVRRSSGMNIKMLSMLSAGRPVVTTSAGARGLPKSLRRHCRVADRPIDFAQAIAEALAQPTPIQRDARTSDISRACGRDRVRAFIEELRRVSVPTMVRAR